MAAQRPTLIKDARVFDGVNEDLTRGDVLVSERRIEQVSPTSITPPRDALVVDADGRVLMPGLSDAHWHMVFAPNTMDNLLAADTGMLYAYAVAEAEQTLMRGFTTVRNFGVPTFGLRTAIDSGAIPGPRVYPSGALISQTAGHGDFGPAYDRPVALGGAPSRFEEIGAFLVANGVGEVQAAVRSQLKRGASQIKLALGGGVISDSDPLDTLQFTPDEIAAAVQVAADWGTYVATHVYTAPGVRRAVEAGVRSIEHGHLLDQETVALMAERNVWLSIQPFQAGDNPLTPAQMAKAEPTSHWDRVVAWARDAGTHVAFGTDLLFQPGKTGLQSVMLTRLAKVYGNAGALRIATSQNAALFAESGNRNPYGEARLGVVEEGAWADLLLVDGDPIADITVLTEPEQRLSLVVKDGRIHKNLLA